MIQFGIPQEKKARLLLDTDAKNEVDDQFAIVHALLSEAIELRGIVSAHFGQRRTLQSEQESYDEILHLMKLMRIKPEVPSAIGQSRAGSPALCRRSSARFVNEFAHNT